MIWAADFETTTKPEDCHVWAWAMCEVGNPENLFIGTDIYDFMHICETRPENPEVYFHNLKFDSQFVISWLFENGFRHVTESRDRATKTFTTMISDSGLYYIVEVVFWKRGKNIKKVTFYDSLKLLPMSVDAIAKAFRMETQKGSIDYSAHDDLPYNSPLTKEEEEYIIADVRIIAHALAFLRSQGLEKITIGSCAMAEYKKLIGKKQFDRWFPPVNYRDIKQSYRGGVTQVAPEIAGKTVGRGVVLDVNGLFSWVMKEKVLPHGKPKFFTGQYKPDDLYPLYIQTLQCSFDLKPGKIPTIQVKDGQVAKATEYLTTSDDEELVLCLTNVDLALFLENYDVYNLEYINGWKFMGTRGLFDAYVDKWQGAKEQAAREKNWGLRLLAKLYLNSLYGKFGTADRRKSKEPYLEDGVVKYRDCPEKQAEAVYVPVAAFITSYARERTIRAAQRIKDDYAAGKSKIRFAYCDTDSLHLLTDDFSLPEGLEIDPYKLGAWKFESKFTRARFLRQKCYIEESTEDVYGENPEYKLKVTVAGMPEECYDQVNFKNFKIGAKYYGKKSPQVVPGGVVLRSIDFTIKR